MLVCIFLFDTYYAAKALGYMPDEVTLQAHPYSDARVLLALDTLITVTHLSLPIRWCKLLLLEILTPVAYYVFAVCFDSPDGSLNVIFNVLILTFLTFLSAMGKRAMEISERKAFVDVISEKSLRYQAEHQLSLSVIAEIPGIEREQPSSVAASSATFDLSSCSAFAISYNKTYQDQGTQTSFPPQLRVRPPLPPTWPTDLSGRPMPSTAVSIAAQKNRKSGSRQRSHSAPGRSGGSDTDRQRCVLQRTGPTTLKQFARSTTQAAELACAKGLLHLNVGGRGCCSYHLGVTAMQKALERMLTSQCDRSFKPHDGWQCSSCKALNELPEHEDDGIDCELCWHTRGPTCASQPLAHSVNGKFLNRPAVAL
eukprot:TRINITY_DN32051_c0_g1_i1.p1 TRINITY_DN32051_c0_g1~~TRINITY_DN32051_c0_g1_i1.p1  ORF type:complete len:368 (-),score=24.24 TRINITY_DN32051_c0_g1_i1:449-1552(-)